MTKREKSDFSILVVDDEPDILFFIKAILGEYQVQTAENVVQGMEILVDSKIDLIISDIKMPQSSGYDLTALNQFLENGTPVVLISGHENLEEMVAQSEGGDCVACLEKPFSRKELLETVEKALEFRQKNAMAEAA